MTDKFSGIDTGTPSETARRDPWQQLRRLTPARIALGHTGTSLPTAAHLEFQYAHAQARDAVHLPFERQRLADEIEQGGGACLQLHSAAADRDTYLKRPDLGRRLHPDAIEILRGVASAHPAPYDLGVVIADGLSALAVHRNSLPLLHKIQELARAEHWTMAPTALVTQGRVAVGDQIGELLRVRMLIVLIGERPGLSSPDSLGLYFTYEPKAGLSDVDRNCISNIREEGLSYGMAAHKLRYLLREATRRGLSGVLLKEEAQVPLLEGAEPAQVGNFLTDNR